MSGHLFENKMDFSELISALSVKSGEYADIIRIKAELFSLNKQKDELFMSLGKMIYKMSHKGGINQQRITEKCARIEELDRIIKAKENEIEHVHEYSQKLLKRKPGKKTKHKHKDEFDDYVVERKDCYIEPLD